MSEETVPLRVYRSGSGEFEEFAVPFVEGMTVLDGVVWAQRNEAPGLAFRRNCGAARCGSCAAEIDGEPRLMCSTPLPRSGAAVEPMAAFPVVRDLAVDVDGMWDVARRVPGFERGEGLDRMWQEDVDDLSVFQRCIECFLCMDVCHVLRVHGGEYVGPRFVVKLAALNMHPRDGGDRSGFAGESGVELCNVTRCCQDTCPEDIPITDDAIIPEKERLISGLDPVVRLLRSLFGRNG